SLSSTAKSSTRPDGVAGPIDRNHRRSSGPLPADFSVKTGVGGGGACAASAAVRRSRAAVDDNRRVYMGISGRRDSTTYISLLDWAIAASLALTVLVFLVGVDIRIGGATLRSHSAIRVLAGAAALIVFRLRLGVTSYPKWIMRLVMLIAICGSVETWFRFLLASIGGADSYGYVSASRMIASGRLIEPAPIADWLSAPNRMALASPLGWTPSPDATGITPTFPVGVSAVMALFTLIGGAGAVFFVAPVIAVITLWLVYRLAGDWFDAETGLFAAALVAWNPLFITYAKQPMSDVPAAMWVMLALVLAVRSTSLTGFAAGLAAGAAVITRPALLVAAAVIPLTAYRGESARLRFFAS